MLVVDDEPGIRDLLSRTFALAEYDVDVAPDGLTALDRMRQTRYDLLIADLRMPVMDGLSMIREAKRLSPTETGLLVNDLVVSHFPDIVDFHFTAHMEEDLDDVAIQRIEP